MNWHHRLLAEKLDQVARGKIKRLMVFCPPQHGKALAVDTPIPTPDGWREVGKLKVGDTVFAADGTPTTVVAVSPVWRDRRVWSVGTKNGTSIIADGEHLWKVRLCRKHKKPALHTTESLAIRQETMRAFRAPQVDCHPGLFLPDRELPIPPYTLGVWLGDGRNQFGSIAKGEDDLPHLLQRIEADGFRVRPQKQVCHVGILGLQELLRAQGLLANKHIPQAYLRAGRAQRVALLQGLIDTDGYVAPDGQVEFCTTEPRLADGVYELLATLGVKASIIKGRATLYGKDCGAKYRIMFYFAEAASLPRKKANCRNGNRKPGHYLMLSEAGKADTVCIQVAHPDGMFLAGRGMIPTHNSELVSRRFPAYMLGRNPDLRLLSCSHTADLATSMNRDVQRIMSQDAYRRLFPETRLSDKWVRGSAKNSYRRTLDFFEVVGRRGSLRTAGVGVSIAGNPADGGIIDDPFGKREDAGSPTIRQRVWDWYANDFYTRLSRDAWIVLTHTRWHRDDLAGRLLRKMADRHGEKWEILCLPALATEGPRDPSDPRKPGEALWPAFKDRETLLTMQRQDARAFAALYQQDPVAGSSSEWSEELFGPWIWCQPDQWPKREEFLATALCVDPSLGKSDKQGDYSAIVFLGIARGLLWVAADLDRRSPTETVRKTILACEHYKPQMVGIEANQFQQLLVHEFQRQMHGRLGMSWPVFRIDNRVHKLTRIRRLGQYITNRELRVLDNEGGRLLVDQLMDFPHGEHDDGPDALEMAVRLILESAGGSHRVSE